MPKRGGKEARRRNAETDTHKCESKKKQQASMYGRVTVQVLRIFFFRSAEKPQTWVIKPSFTIDYVNSVPKYCRLQIEPKREYNMTNFNNF